MGRLPAEAGSFKREPIDFVRELAQAYNEKAPPGEDP